MLKVRDHVKTFTSTDFYFSFMLGLMDFSDTAILCRLVGQIVVANKILSVLISLYFPKVCFHERAAMTVKLN